MYLTQHQELGPKNNHAPRSACHVRGVPRGDSFGGDFSGHLGTRPAGLGEPYFQAASATSCFLFKLDLVWRAMRNLFRKGREESTPVAGKGGAGQLRGAQTEGTAPEIFHLPFTKEHSAEHEAV